MNTRKHVPWAVLYAALGIMLAASYYVSGLFTFFSLECKDGDWAEWCGHLHKIIIPRLLDSLTNPSPM